MKRKLYGLNQYEVDLIVMETLKEIKEKKEADKEDGDRERDISDS